MLGRKYFSYTEVNSIWTVLWKRLFHNTGIFGRNQLTDFIQCGLEHLYRRDLVFRDLEE